MKRTVFIFVLMAINVFSAFCGGIQQQELVNMQEIDLDRIANIEIRYGSDPITVFSTNSNIFVIKEYMTENNSSYYAKITNSGNTLIVEAGRRPWGLFNAFFRANIEVYIPVSNRNITVRTSSGRIETVGECIVSLMTIESASGNIMVNAITAQEVNLKTSSGNINCQNVNGNTVIETSSGSIRCSIINGDLFVKSSSGNIVARSINGTAVIESSSGSIYCVATENAGDITITTSSGSVTLDIPRNFAFNFSSRSSSGSLHTPFSDKLYSRLSDRNYIQGVIGGDNVAENQINTNIDIRTSYGSIKVNWIN